MSGEVSARKSYDGSHVVVHNIASGESLSLIASHYKLPHWHCIWH